MRRKIILVIALAISFLYVLGVFFELYLKTPLIDIAQHFLFGAALSLIWIGLAHSKQYGVSLMATIGFVLLVSLAWEIFELLFWNYVPNYSSVLMLHSPTVGDALSDMTAALIGGVIFTRLFRI